MITKFLFFGIFFFSVVSLQSVYGQEEFNTTLQPKEYSDVVPKDGMVVSVLIKESNSENDLLIFFRIYEGTKNQT